MNSLTKILIVLICAGFGLATYAASSVGWGVGSIIDKQTMKEIRENCPDYYKNQNGDCLSTTFRSYYLMSGTRGGSFGSGK
ncbi:MAG: hypothetical protein R3C61_13275 [Bacteroidia bacterium]